MSAHARLAPSASAQWFNCPGSIPYIEQLVKAGRIKADEETEWSREGTLAHDWAAKVLRHQTKISNVPMPFRPHIAEYARVCAECEEGMHPHSYRFVESKLPLFYAPSDTGTTDYGLARLNKKERVERIDIRDLKYGAGVPVDAEENTQLAIYGMSLVTDLEEWNGKLPDHIPMSIGIHQPRYKGDDALKLWELTVGELREFCQPLRKVARMIQQRTKELPMKATPKGCRFCPARFVCKVKAETIFEGTGIMDLSDFTNLDLPEPDALEIETLVGIWNNMDQIKKWLNNNAYYLLNRLTAGETIEGLKMVKGRDGNRNWKDQEAVEKFLLRYIQEEEAYETTLISPAQAEDKLKGKFKGTLKALRDKLDTFTSRTEGRPVLARADDKREEIDSALKLFVALPEEDDLEG